MRAFDVVKIDPVTDGSAGVRQALEALLVSAFALSGNGSGAPSCRSVMGNAG